MSHAVLDALYDDQPLVVEAGTGTGKTLAYTLPAVLVAARQEKRLVLSTHTRNLQQQLSGRDLPWLWKHLGLDAVRRTPKHSGLRYAKLLGRNNYVCRHALQAWIDKQCAGNGSRLAAQVLLALLRSPDGTLEDVLPDLPTHVWLEIHSRRGACVGRRCKGDNPCPVYRGRDAARCADLLVVNHALLLADARGGGGILGEWPGAPRLQA
jgi:Rad3-related DNA helicase